MNLFQIEHEVLQCVDLETGEIINEEFLNELEMARDAKIENIALWIKNLVAESEALKAEKLAFAERQKQAENKADGLKKYLSSFLDGSSFKSNKVSISFRKSEVLEVSEKAEIPDRFLIEQEPKLDKAGLKKFVKQGNELGGVSLVENKNIQIK